MSKTDFKEKMNIGVYYYRNWASNKMKCVPYFLTECKTVAHHKCYKKMAHTCGVNQAMFALALEKLDKLPTMQKRQTMQYPEAEQSIYEDATSLHEQPKRPLSQPVFPVPCKYYY